MHTLGDAHVYKNHVEPLKQQLLNAPRPFPVGCRLPGLRGFQAVEHGFQAGEQRAFMTAGVMSSWSLLFGLCGVVYCAREPLNGRDPLCRC